LSISSLPKYIALWPRAHEVGAEAEWWKTVLLSVLNNLHASLRQGVGAVRRILILELHDELSHLFDDPARCRFRSFSIQRCILLLQVV
jgi:hypothetical protein